MTKKEKAIKAIMDEHQTERFPFDDEQRIKAALEAAYKAGFDAAKAALSYKVTMIQTRRW